MKIDSLDTNLIVHYIAGDIPEQRKKVETLLKTPGMVHRIESLTITETVYVLEKAYASTREETINQLNFFLARFSDHISYDHHLTSKVFPFYLAHPKLSFDDCYLAALAELNNATPLYTFDKKLANQHPAAKLLS